MTSIKSGVGAVVPSDDLSACSRGQLQRDKIDITGFKLVASYNWTNETKPTIIIPGAPNVWTPKNFPLRVPQDSGKIFIDQNKVRFPKSPLEPLIRTVNFVNPNFDLSSVDIVTDRNNLRKLYRWVSGDRDLQEFRIDAELAGNTVLFTRWDPKCEEVIRIGEFRGFGHEFEKANTRPATGCERGTGHHRIVTYVFGDLKMLVRFEVDGCFSLTKDTTVPIDKNKPKKSTSPIAGTDDGDSLAAALGGMAISKKPTPFDATTKLNYIEDGVLVDQSEILELKTRVNHKALDWEDTWPQLYFSQTPTLLLAKHMKGQFITVQRNQFNSATVLPLVRAGQSSLVRLEKVLSTMKALVKRNDVGHGVSFIYENGVMKVYLRDGNPANTKVEPSLVILFKNNPR